MNDRENVIISTIKLIEKSLKSNHFSYKNRANMDLCAHDIFMTLIKQREIVEEYPYKTK